MSFLIDVLIYFKFHYFYQSLSLYIVPLLINAWFFNIDEWQQVARESRNEFGFVIEYKDTPNERTIFKNVYKLDDTYFHYCINIYIKCLTYYEITQKYEALKDWWNLYIGLFYYSIMLLTCLYVFFVNYTMLL